ncbi:MAG: glycoside hydrolase family 2 [Sphingobacteriaceae bacterium]|nr:MAG: glycoside hydrolase family 2 [Sphingobacteriaceae bacterium]
MKMNFKKLLYCATLMLVSSLVFGQKWEPKQARLMTKYAQNVSPQNVLPEYPRPQLVRSKWLNLNGLWEYQPGVSAQETLPKSKLTSSILVPFAVESALSGVMEHHDRLWYRRKFTVPASWKGEKILLHFGAVDYESEVFINGKSLGKHTGGYDPFSFDITSALTKTGEQEIAVRVFDPTDDGGQPRGKQTLRPQGIMYTSTTGIWQTVWLEPVPKTNIENIKIVPDIDQSVVKLKISSANATGYQVDIQVKQGNSIIQTITGKPNTEITVPIKNAKLWSPDSPFLYDLKISLKKGNATTDAISSYFGMRKISVEQQDGYKKLFLNNKFLFELGPLDQGFWPDGIYTAPTDEALKSDIVAMKDFGFNMVRKHIKVEPYRWYYWADKLGLMVWQDMPSPNSYTEHVPLVDTAAFRSQLTKMIQTHWNSPSIIMWVVFNESQAQHNTPQLVNMVKQLDPSRLVNQASGGSHFGAGDVYDIHSYPPPAAPQNNKVQALACGEYGGIGYIIPNHIWKSGPTYIMMDNQKAYTDLYTDFANDLAVFKTNNGLSAAVYTEITDVEVELNGLLTYDRAVVKGPAEIIRAANNTAINKNLYLTEVLPTSEKNTRNWKYSLTKPDSASWFKSDFNTANWQNGQAGFGSEGTPGAIIKTKWTSHDIWLRQEFNLGDLSKIKDNLVLSIHHDDRAIVYINGVKAAELGGATSGYAISQITQAAKNALVSNGKNVIAIHCHQDGGGQFIDAGISIMSDTKP